MKPIVLIGAGGHCTSCIEAIESTGEWEIAGLVDIEARLGERVLGYEIIGSDDQLPMLAGRFGFALVTVGQITAPTIRRKVFDAANKAGFAFPAIAASSAWVSKSAQMGDGSIAMHSCFINAEARIGRNCIINTGSLIEHGVAIGDHCHISTGAIVNGDCIVGDGVMIGSGAVLRNGITVASGCVVGAGAVVTKNLDEAGTYIGCPARRMA